MVPVAEAAVVVKYVILVAGHAGSGKTEVCKLLATRLHWPMLDKDTLTRPLVEALSERFSADPHDRQSEAYLTHVRPLEYAVIQDVMWEQLELGAPGVLVSAPFVRELCDKEWVENLRFDCEVRGFELKVVWVRCDRDTLRNRIVARGADRDRWKLLNWTEWTTTLAEPDPPLPLIYIDNSRDAVSSLVSHVDVLIGGLDLG